MGLQRLSTVAYDDGEFMWACFLECVHCTLAGQFLWQGLLHLGN